MKWIYWLLRKIGYYKTIHLEEDGIADTDILSVPYRKEWVTLSNMEYLNNWLYMNRQQRNVIFESQQKAVKKGEVEKVHYEKDGHKAYYLRATKKGANYLYIHQKKDEIYRDEANKG